MMNRQKKAVLTACSDPVSPDRLPDIEKLKTLLQAEGLNVKLPEGFFDGSEISPGRKGALLTESFRDSDVDYIFDISGGDLANFVLPHLDYDVIRNSRAVFFGYSDLTTVINAVIAKTGRIAVNYQIRNLLYDHAEEQLNYFRKNILNDNIMPDDLELEFLRGSGMEGRILGGNIRCFLKLAGTGYWPDMKGSILLLESLGGGVFQMMTALEQYRQMEVFDQVNGVIFGTFSKMEEEQLKPEIGELIQEIVPEHISVARTRYIGHYTDARAVVLGKRFVISGK